MHFVSVVISGMSDVPLAALRGATPLQRATLPAFDRLASQGLLGRVQVVPEEAPAGSVVGLPALLGYDGAELALRRGPLEAAGLGVSLAPDDLALRLNFVSTYHDTMADTRAGHVSDREARVLIEALRRLDTPLELEIHFGSGYRHLAVLRGGAAMEVSTLPPQEVLGQPLRDFYPFGGDAGPLVRFLDDAGRALADHDVNRVRIDLGENPADAVWLWGEGVDRAVPSLGERLGLEAALIAGAPLVRGLGVKLGMHAPRLPGVTGELGTDLKAKCLAVREALRDHEFVMVHVASVNEASRAGDARAKVRELTRVDRLLVAPLLQWVEQRPAERRLLLTSDHQTSVEAAVRNVDPVPFAVYGAGLESVREQTFDEEAARASELQLADARALLDFLLRGRGRSRGA